MHTKHALVFLTVFLFFHTAFAAALIKVASVETQNAQGTFLAAFSMQELDQISVVITNVGDQPCAPDVGLTIKDSSNNILWNVLLTGVPSLNSGESHTERFLKSSAPTEFQNAPYGTYRAIGTASCAPQTDSKTLVFSVVEKTNLQIPETHPLALLLILLCILWFVHKTPSKNRSKS